MYKHVGPLPQLSAQMKVFIFKGNNCMCRGCLLLITFYCTPSPSKFTPATQVVLDALKIGVQTPVSPQQELSKPGSLLCPLGFGAGTPQVIKKQVWEALTGMSLGRSTQRRHFSALRAARGRFWSLQLTLALPSLDSMKE